MVYLLDTCSLSEITRERPDPNVDRFFANLASKDACVSAVTIAEISKGIELLKPGKRRTRLEKWFQTDLLTQFHERVLPFDSLLAQRWGSMIADLSRRGWTMPLLDSMIAITALVHGLTIVTRNEPDFAHCGTRVLNPWR